MGHGAARKIGSEILQMQVGEISHHADKVISEPRLLFVLPLDNRFRNLTEEYWS